MSNKVTVTIILSIFMYSCTQKNKINQVKDGGLTVQVMQMEDTPDDNSTTNYRARLIPDKSFTERQSYQQKTNLLYQMDSCFYLQEKDKKTYPVLVQAIANGVGGTFEYMLEFETSGARGKDVRMIYQDKYLTRKKYDLKLN